MPNGPPSQNPKKSRPIIRGMLLVGTGALLAIGLGGLLVVADLRFDGGRLVHVALGTEALAEACRAPLVHRLAEKGFEPFEIEFGPSPTVGSPWERNRSFGDSFTFRDGAAQRRIDGVVACVVSEGKVTVEFRVGSNPHRDV